MKSDAELDLTDLRVVMTVAETASYTRAAQKLGLSQPAVSRRVTALEQSLNARLFRRDGRLFVPTEAGSAFCERAGEILALMQRLPASTASAAGNPRGSVALGLPPTTGEMLAPILVPDYRKAYPDVFLRIEQGYVNDLFDMLMDKRIDVALLNGPFSPASVDLEPLLDHHLGIVYPEAWQTCSPLDGRPMPAKLTLAEVARLPLILPSSNQSLRHLVDGAFRAKGLKPNVVMEVNSYILQRSLVQPELGCIFMSQSVVHHSRGRDIAFAPISDASLIYTYYVATRKVGQPTLAAKLLVRMIRHHMHHVARLLFADT